MRVLVSTLLASTLVVALFVTLLVEQVGRGLVDDKTRAALVEARSGLLTARGELEAGGATGRRPPRARCSTSPRACPTGEPPGACTTSPSWPRAPAPASCRRVAAASSTRCRSRCSTGSRRSPGRSTPSRPVPATGSDEEALVVGSVLDVPSLGRYRLIHVFPLDNERATLSLVLRTATAAGLLLVVLLGLIAALVTRQVVSPVRLAARTAERLAAGRLEERMQVRGEDELARLGSSFNSMAEALQSQIRQLEDLSRVQRRFVSDVSHELRTPLTTVRMAADVLFASRSRFPSDVGRSAELLQDELDRFETLLADLLEISRYDAGAASLDATPTDLVPLVHRVVEAAQPLADRKGSRIDLSGVPAGPVVVEIDPCGWSACCATSSSTPSSTARAGRSRLSVAGDADTVAVLVRDHGVGLQPGQAGMVFTRFWRADPSRARSTGGTGLGLAIALEDVRLHGGWLQAVGLPGRARRSGSPCPPAPAGCRARARSRCPSRWGRHEGGPLEPWCGRAGAPGCAGGRRAGRRRPARRLRAAAGERRARARSHQRRRAGVRRRPAAAPRPAARRRRARDRAGLRQRPGQRRRRPRHRAAVPGPGDPRHLDRRPRRHPLPRAGRAGRPGRRDEGRHAGQRARHHRRRRLVQPRVRPGPGA
jgi:two-component system sensor histidine kinase MtrB